MPAISHILHLTFHPKTHKMKQQISLLLVVMAMLGGCSTKPSESMNPFLSDYDTPFGVPPFDIIENSHFMPAAEKGFSEQLAEIEAMVTQAEAPTFENTIEAYLLSGELLRKVEGVFFQLLSAETSDEIDSIARILVPMRAAHNSSIMLHAGLFQRVKSVYDNQEGMNLNREQTVTLEKIYKRFIRGGANLNEEGKRRISEIDERLSSLTLEFGNKVLAETNAYQMVLDSEEDLAGLPESVRSAASDAATAAGLDGKWVFTLHKPSWIPFLMYSEKRELREKIYKAMYMRCNQGNEHDNNEVIREILQLRLERANLLGYDSHADFVLEERMAKEPANVYELLMKVWEPALAKAKEEADMMQEMIDKEGGEFQLASWDWWYYAEKIRKEQYALDEEEIRAYFSLETVIDGLFDVVNKLYGLTFEPRFDLPVYHEEVMPYEIREADGSHLGVLYMDFHPRPGKRGGAWSSGIRTAHVKDGKQITPVGMIVMNFTRPTGDTPALLSFDETLTFFHEFGHALHGAFKKSHYLGTGVAWDFVELPSQIMQNWAEHPEVLKTYAKHYQTGDPIPEELIQKMDAASKFNQGFVTVEYTAASILDMDYHTLKDLSGLEPNAFEQTSMEKIGLIREIIPRYKSNYFQHIFSWGYSSGYYSYMWSEVLDKDAFNAFLETSLFDQATATSFRKNILERGGSEEEMKMYVNFRGKEPTIEPLLTGRGLN
jgi:peptidyl-dipeptidase Dcp